MPDLPPHLIEHVAERFRVLSDPNRLRIIETLRAAGELNVGDIVQRLEMSQANVSKHLKLLHDAAVVRRRQEGTSAYYSVADPTITLLCEIVCDRLREQKGVEAAAFARS